ncbi:MAG TPA: TetR/AcrR family transcriptional regulator [Chloroflexia bacterium]|nr:TetR/AcrR family transcriptional regulator [Chloroflexia bacterium]
MPKIVTEEERANVRHLIIQAAAEEFARVGFEQAKMEVISEKAGIGKGTVYLHFNSKQALFSAMLKEIAGEQLSELRQALQPVANQPLKKKLQVLMETFNRLITGQPEGFRVFISSLYGVNRQFKLEAAEHRRAFLTLIEDLLKEALQTGEIKVPVEPASLLILNACESLALLAGSLGFDTDFVQENQNLIVNMLYSGLKLEKQ